MLPMIHMLVEQWASILPEKTAVIQGARRVSYGELNRNAAAVAGFLLRNGLVHGDRVGVLSENSPEYVAAWLGIQKAGGIPVDVNYQYGRSEIKKVLAHSLPLFLVAERKHLDRVLTLMAELPSIRRIIGIDCPPRPSSAFAQALLQEPYYTSFDEVVGRTEAACRYPVLRGQDLAAIVYTSGTTGAPKGVMLSHDNFSANALAIISYLGITERDSVMVVLPFCYSYGKSLLTTHLAAGGTLVLENSFLYPNVVLNRMAEEAVTGFAGVPSTFALLLNKSNVRNYRFPKLRYLTQAGGPLPPRHAEEVRKAFPGSSLYIMYGQTEATARLTYLDPGDAARKPGSIGKAVPGVKIEIRKEGNLLAGPGEEGELVVTGKNVMAGYWNNPGETNKVLRNGALYTGDMGMMDEEGFIFIAGRRGDMIKSGAHRISPREVEETILELDEVHETVVVGSSDEILGETLKAFIVARDGAALDAKRIQQHCRARLASFKIPKDVVFVQSLPKTFSGKVMRHELKRYGEPPRAGGPGKDSAATL